MPTVGTGIAKCPVFKHYLPAALSKAVQHRLGGYGSTIFLATSISVVSPDTKSDCHQPVSLARDPQLLAGG